MLPLSLSMSGGEYWGVPLVDEEWIQYKSCSSLLWSGGGSSSRREAV